MAAEAAPADAAKLAAYRAALDAALTRFPLDEEFWLQRGQAESPDPAERGQGSVAARSATTRRRWPSRRHISPRIII